MTALRAERPAAPLTPAGLARACSLTLQQLLAGADDPIGAVAEAANANRKTAANILRGDNAPNGVHLLHLMANVPGFAARMAELTGDGAWWLPEYEQARQQVLAEIARRDFDAG